MCNNICPDFETLTDEKLVCLVNQGNYDALGILIRRYMPHIAAYAKKFSSVVSDSDDLISEGTLAVFSAVKCYSADKSSFKTFVKLCIERAINAKVKSANANRRIPSGMLTSIDSIDLPYIDDPEKIIIRNEEKISLLSAIKEKLSAFEFKVFSSFLEGKSYADISKELDVSLKSVDGALQRIRNKIKK